MLSILIPCYNSERWVGAAIESALAQTWPDKEIIVVDDGSTDSSLEVIRNFGDRIRWESVPNRGGGAARNLLLRLAHGEWVQYLDADDWLRPDKLALQVPALQAWDSGGGIDVLYGPGTNEHHMARGIHTTTQRIPEPHDPWVLLARWWLPQTGAPLWRRQALLEVGGWTEDQPCCQEHELYLRLLMAGKKFRYHPAGGAVYRVWSEETLCRRDKGLTRRERRKITRRLETHLEATGQMTSERRWAINQARFELARMAWLTDRAEAAEIMAEVRRSELSFRPGEAAAPPPYRLAYRWFGFEGAERVAGAKRAMAEKSARLLRKGSHRYLAGLGRSR